MTKLASPMNGRFVKDSDWSKFLVKSGKYIKTKRGDKIVYHNLISSASARLTTLEVGVTKIPPPQPYDPFATQPTSVPQVVPTDVTALMAQLETLERTV